MTTRRLIASLTVSAAALAVAATFAVRSFPLEAQGRAPSDNGAPIQVVNGAEHLLHGDTPDYPDRAIEQKVEGDVVVDMTLNDRGEVSDARVLSGPEELRKATLEAVLQWHYAPAALRSTVTQATLRFRLPAAVPLTMKVIDEKVWRPMDVELSGHVLLKELPDGTLHVGAYARAEHVAGPLREIQKAMDDPAMSDEQRAEYKAQYPEMKRVAEKIAELRSVNELVGKLVDPGSPRREALEGSPRLVHVRTERISEATAMEVLAQAGVAIGDAITKETAERIEQAAQSMDGHFRVEFENGGGGLIVLILAR
jgi:TonB family protein